MKKVISQGIVTLFLQALVVAAFAGGPEVVPTSSIISGFYMGIGASTNSAVESFNSKFIATDSAGASTEAPSHVDAQDLLLTPIVQLGYWHPLCDGSWLWGFTTQWKYLGYKTPNDARGLLGAASAIPNLYPFSSANTDVTFQNRINTEILFLPYLGVEHGKNLFYLGLGTSLFTTYSTIFARVGTSTASASQYQVMWGGALQFGYDYYFSSASFFNINYTYAATGTYSFDNGPTDAAAFFGGGKSGSSATFIEAQRNLQFMVQEIMFSVNRAFND